MSDYAAAEVASVIARRVRTRDLTEAEAEARAAFDSLDHWIRTFVRPVETAAGDIATAVGFIRHLDLERFPMTGNALAYFREQFHQPEDRSAIRVQADIALALRAPDAINIAIDLRLGVVLATFDKGMAFCASTLGVAVAPA